ncbi:MAG: lipopolysaccharide biosynthesis protein [Pseudomonadales bacterium]
MSESTSPVSRTLKNFGVLMGGRAVAGVLSVVALTLVARVLGAEQFGLLVLVHTTAIVVRGLLNFKPSDTLVRYGVTPFDEQDAGTLAALLRFTLGLDLICALAAATVAAAVLGLAAPRLGLPEELAGPVMLYALALLVSGTGTAMGMLRVAGRFDAISVQQTVGPTARLLGIGLAYVLEATLAGYLFVWALALAAEYLYLNVLGWVEIRRQRLHPGVPDLRNAESRFPGVWLFVRTLYWQSNVDLAQRHGLILFAGVFLGAAGAGMFRVAREFADVLAKPVVVIRQAVFPDLARLWRSRDPQFTRLYVRLGILGGTVAVAVVVFIGAYGRELLAALVGDGYTSAATLLTWLMVAAAVDLIGAALRPAAYAMGAAAAALRIQLTVAACHLSLFVGLVSLFGLSGAGVAAAVASVLLITGMALLVARHASRFPEADAETPQ